MSDGWTREYVVEVKHAELIAGSPFSHPFREEIVRCRDCTYLIAHGTGCSYWDFCDVYDTNGFCAWGVRRDA